MKVVACLAVFVATALATPVGQVVPKFDVDRDLLDPKATFLTKVPCAFCNETLLVLLEQCKIHDARSTEHIDDFLIRCTEIGGLQPSKLDLMTTECSEAELNNRRVNFVYQRRLRCAKIYRALLDLYTPYDPCLQIRNDYQKNALSVCRSSGIDCVLPPINVTAAQEKAAEAPYTVNGSVVFHLPPLSCERYVSDAVDSCAEMKKTDFYAKSNLAGGWCKEKYYHPFQTMGCESVVSKLSTRDLLMDMCNGLKLFPLKKQDFAEVCRSNLKMNPKAPVMVLEYHKYLSFVKSIGQESDYNRILNSTTTIARDQLVYLPTTTP